jgi:hypothetical protein
MNQAMPAVKVACNATLCANQCHILSIHLKLKCRTLTRYGRDVVGPSTSKLANRKLEAGIQLRFIKLAGILG